VTDLDLVDRIREEYGKGASGLKIARSLGISLSRVYRIMERYGIKRRSFSECVRLRWRSGFERRYTYNRREVEISLQEWQKGYIAGFLDGEGYIGINKSRSCVFGLRPRICITNTRKDALEIIRGWLGFGVIYENRSRERDPRHNPEWTLEINGYGSLKSLLKAIAPYLIIKRRQAELLLRFLDLDPLNSEHVAVALEIYVEMKKLNKRGR
jgi:hypothetical protein